MKSSEKEMLTKLQAQVAALITMVRMNGFQAGNIDAIRCERVVCVVKAGDLRAKAFQIVFGRDGSLFITFPYFKHRVGLLSSSSIFATGTRQSQANLEKGGKVTSHLVMRWTLPIRQKTGACLRNEP